MNWTEEQKKAIFEKENNILVAAAARKRENSSFGRTNDSKNSKRKNGYRSIISSNFYECSCF